MKVVPLDSVCNISMGQAPKGDTYNNEGHGLQLIAGAGDFGNITPEPSKYTSAPTKVSSQGDIVVCIRATIGDRNWADRNYCLGRGVAGLRASPEELDQQYLWHWVGYSAPTLKAKGRGATFLQVSKSDIAEMPIPLPPLPEQRRIAAILDKADALRQKRQQAIAKLDELLQSVFLEMFGDPVTNPKDWPRGRIGDLLESAKYGTSGKAFPVGDWPILRMGNITYAGEWSFESMKYINLTEVEQSKYLVHKGELLFNRTNSKELVGKTAVYREDKPMAFAGYLVKGTPKHPYNSEYVSAYLNSRHGKQTLLNLCKSIVGMANINAKEMQGIKILVPPADQQLDFQRKTHQVRLAIVAHKAAFHKSETLFSSLQQRAFNGTL